jgi:hypothetical protein
LILEQHQIAGGVGARVAASVVEQHQRQQAADLGLGGQRARGQLEVPAQADRLDAQLAAHQRVAAGRGVALVEDQVDHRQRRVEPHRQLVGVGHPVRDAGVADLALGAHQPLRHRRLGHRERARDRRGRQPADQPQRQRHLRGGCQRRVAAGEDQPQPIVGDRLGRGGARGLLARLVGDDRPQLDPSADRVDGLVAGDLHQPAARLGGRAVGPRRRRRRERLLHRLLGEVEVAVAHAQRRRQHARALGAERGLDRGGHGALASLTCWCRRGSGAPRSSRCARWGCARRS